MDAGKYYMDNLICICVYFLGKVDLKTEHGRLRRDRNFFDACRYGLQLNTTRSRIPSCLEEHVVYEEKGDTLQERRSYWQSLTFYILRKYCFNKVLSLYT